MKITVVGPLNKYPERNKINIGDTINFEKALDPAYGKTVKVFSNENIEIGMVAAKEKTSVKNTSLAEEVFDNSEISETFTGKVSSIEFVGRNKVLVVEIIEGTVSESTTTEVEIDSKNKTKESRKYRQVFVEVVGSKKQYEDRYLPLKVIKKVKDVETINIPSRLEFNKADNTILVHVNCAMSEKDPDDYRLVGTINPLKSDKIKTEYKTAEEFMNIMNAYRVDGEDPEMEASITGSSALQSTLTYSMSVKIFGQTSLEEATEVFEQEMDPSFLNNFKNFLEEFTLSEKIILKGYNYLKEINHEKSVRIPEKTMFDNYDCVMEDVMYSFLAESNTMLVGPMAAGKNTCLEALAYQFGQKLFEVQVNSYIDNDTLLGTRTIKAKADTHERDRINEEGMKLIQALSGMNNKKELKAKIESENDTNSQIQAVETVSQYSGIDFTVLINAMKNGETEISFQPSAIIEAMEQGAWVVIDEFNTGQPSVMAVLNSVLDDRKRIQVPGYGLVKAKPGFRLFATMNPEYEGTCSLNPATSSRFTHVIFRAADKISPIILSRVPDSPKSFLSNAETLYKHIRTGIASGKLQEESINVRGFIRAAKAVTLGQEAKRAFITHVTNGISDSDDRKSIKDFIDISIH